MHPNNTVSKPYQPLYYTLSTPSQLLINPSPPSLHPLSTQHPFSPLSLHPLQHMLDGSIRWSPMPSYSLPTPLLPLSTQHPFSPLSPPPPTHVRWVYPLVPDAQLLPDASYVHTKRYTYKESRVPGRSSDGSGMGRSVEPYPPPTLQP